MSEMNHGDVIKLHNDLNRRLEKFGLFIHNWGRLAVAQKTDPYNNYILNNVTDIRVIEGFVSGLEYKKDS